MITAKILKALSTLCFVLLWVPFTLMFIVGEDRVNNEGTGLFAGFGIWLVLCISIAVISAVLLVASLVVGAFANSRILKNGVDADAAIIKISETGTRVNENPVVDIFLEVRPATLPPFSAETRRTVSIVDLPSFQPGRLVNVKYIPGTDQVAIIGPKYEMETT